ncbi:MAG: hypothetical protein AB199_03780 [Parcubacteria bacterium C7867-004]|nr:MAG: hypothetical protein AB199_03780 [Parcubacteria bacterium C7867-004]
MDVHSANDARGSFSWILPEAAAARLSELPAEQRDSFLRAVTGLFESRISLLVMATGFDEPMAGIDILAASDEELIEVLEAIIVPKAPSDRPPS